jgi:hypothetical protein
MPPRKPKEDCVSPSRAALGPQASIGAIAHRQCRLIWLILHQGIRYEERGPAVNKKSKQQRTARMIRELRKLGYTISLAIPQRAIQRDRRDFRLC